MFLLTMEDTMDGKEHFNRRDLIVKTAGTVGVAGAFVAGSPALSQTTIIRPLPKGFASEAHAFAAAWANSLSEITNIDFSFIAPGLAQEEVKERHRIYCYLLMKLIYRFWNGNKHGPLGTYPHRAAQVEFASRRSPPDQRYRGDIIAGLDPENTRIAWDRYLGHNIACIAVDGNGAIIDFDFNHNDLFRSTVEHAESRLVRRLFTLTDGFDSWNTKHKIGERSRFSGWNTGQRVGNRSRSFSLNQVTLYTSLESCAQCSGIMSLANVKEIFYLQNDFTAYMIGNIMYNLANPIQAKDPQNPAAALLTFPGAPLPIPASLIGLEEFNELNEKNLTFCNRLRNADHTDPSQAFFVSDDKTYMDFGPSITSFLCTDDARATFKSGGSKLDTLPLAFPGFQPSNQSSAGNSTMLTNLQCLDEAQRFFNYADVDGNRGSAHKL
jgi:tRNA(Arg) A34 adenosine deaminase TadA